MIIYTPKYVMKIIPVFATPKYFVNSLDTYKQLQILCQHPAP
jgi:hypothetical protein